jgi:phosphoribosylglycinamide formyltransferase-1
MKKIGVLISGRGSNLLALADAIQDGRIQNAEIAIVISNTTEAGGLAKAQERGIATAVLDHRGKKREEHDRAMAEELKKNNVDLICLAGYMRLLSPWFIREFSQQILNILRCCLRFQAWMGNNKRLNTASKFQVAPFIL